MNKLLCEPSSHSGRGQPSKAEETTTPQGEKQTLGEGYYYGQEATGTAQPGLGQKEKLTSMYKHQQAEEVNEILTVLCPFFHPERSQEAEEGSTLCPPEETTRDEAQLP